jgi:hypothetical protein
LVQETGFSDHLPVGEGLLAFRTLEGAAQGAQMIMADYAAHSRAARAVAEQYFDPAAYSAFIQASKAEFGFAKSGYSLSRSGWFSDRSACYLAAGRPVIAQETGFSDHLPVGEGLFAFSAAGDVLAAIDVINTDYVRQRATARALAEERFAADRVLTRLLTLVENTPCS